MGNRNGHGMRDGSTHQGSYFTQLPFAILRHLNLNVVLPLTIPGQFLLLLKMFPISSRVRLKCENTDSNKSKVLFEISECVLNAKSVINVNLDLRTKFMGKI